MGLDMNFFAVANGNEPTDDNLIEIRYFRKHATLHDLLLKEWFKDNPKKGVRDFNGILWEVPAEFFKKLQKICKEDNKKRTHYPEECFWGESHPEDWEETVEYLLPETKKFISEGYKIYYLPWW